MNYGDQLSYDKTVSFCHRHGKGELALYETEDQIDSINKLIMSYKRRFSNGKKRTLYFNYFFLGKEKIIF